MSMHRLGFDHCGAWPRGPQMRATGAVPMSAHGVLILRLVIAGSSPLGVPCPEAQLSEPLPALLSWAGYVPMSPYAPPLLTLGQYGYHGHRAVVSGKTPLPGDSACLAPQVAWHCGDFLQMVSTPVAGPPGRTGCRSTAGPLGRVRCVYPLMIGRRSTSVTADIHTDQFWGVLPPIHAHTERCERLISVWTS